MSEIVLDGVVKVFAARPPVVALDGVAQAVDQASITAVLGPSGCGKSTLLRVIAGFERPDAGTVAIAGAVVAAPGRWVPPERRRIGIVPQEGALFPHLDVAGNVGFALTNRRSAGARTRVAELLELVGLAGYERRRPHELSGGQQQRVALARALAPRPAVVLLDEPFTALDQGLRARLRAEVATVLRHETATALIVTHDPHEAMSFADTIAVMTAGRIVQQGSARSVYHHPRDAHIAAMLGEVQVLPGHGNGTGMVSTVVGPVAEPSPARPPATVRGACDVVVRPEQLRPCRDGVPAVVDAVEFHGHEGIVTLRVDGVVLRARWSAMELPLLHDTITVGVVGRALLITPPSTVDPAVGGSAPGW